MKENLIFEDGGSRGVGRLVLGILGITVTVGALFIGGQIYRDWRQQQRLAEDDEKIAERLVKLGQYYDVIHKLGDGKSDDVRRQFSLAMADELSEIHSTLAVASDDQREFAGRICSLIARDEKIHPGYYQIGAGGGAAAQAQPLESSRTQQVTPAAHALTAGGQK